jgi:hypothetical protein
MRRMHNVPTARARVLHDGHRRSGGAPLRGILKGFQSPLVSMQGVGYHTCAIGFQGTMTRRCVSSFISHTRCAQE